MTRLTEQQVREEWDKSPIFVKWDERVERTQQEILDFAHRIAALAVQEVEREVVKWQEAHVLECHARNHANAEVATLTAQLAERDASSKANEGSLIRAIEHERARAERAEAALAEVTKERDDQRETAILWWEKWNALRAQLATAKREGAREALTKAASFVRAMPSKLAYGRDIEEFRNSEYPATPSGEGCPCGHPIRGHSHHSGSCPADRPATPSPEAREVPTFVDLKVEPFADAADLSRRFEGVRITPADAKRIGILGGWRDAE